MDMTLRIPDGRAAQIVDGLCEATGWTAASGVTKGAWAKDRMAEWIKDTAKRGLLKSSHATITSEIDPVHIT